MRLHLGLIAAYFFAGCGGSTDGWHQDAKEHPTNDQDVFATKDECLRDLDENACERVLDIAFDRAGCATRQRGQSGVCGEIGHTADRARNLMNGLSVDCSKNHSDECRRVRDAMSSLFSARWFR